jgi:putative effector of murein hydrolase LrgA (UPF0299 family)
MLTIAIALLGIGLFVALFGMERISLAAAETAKNVLCAVLLMVFIAALTGAFRRGDVSHKTIGTAAEGSQKGSPRDLQG